MLQPPSWFPPGWRELWRQIVATAPEGLLIEADCPAIAAYVGAIHAHDRLLQLVQDDAPDPEALQLWRRAAAELRATAKALVRIPVIVITHSSRR